MSSYDIVFSDNQSKYLSSDINNKPFLYTNRLTKVSYLFGQLWANDINNMG